MGEPLGDLTILAPHDQLRRSDAPFEGLQGPIFEGATIISGHGTSFKVV